jgi:hypothetical protein
MRTSQLLVVMMAATCTVIAACNKDKVTPTPAAITVVNAMATSNAIVPKFGSDTAGRYYVDMNFYNPMVQVYYGGSQPYTRVAGLTPLLVVPITDTTFKIFNGNFKLQPADIYSFFLSGDTAHVDTMLVKDDIPYITDSTTGIRFVNLSIGGKSLTVNLTSDAAHTPLASLGYRQISAFAKYPATAAVGSTYDFEIRDQATGDLLTTYTLYFPLFRSSTIVIAGAQDPASSTPLSVFSVNNY